MATKAEKLATLNQMIQDEQEARARNKQRQQAALPKTIGTTRSWDETVGEDLFLTNVLPIQKHDSIVKKAGKGAVNFAVSAVSAPGEVLRHTAITGGNVLSGQGLKPVAKNTSFTGDILAAPLANKLNAFEEKHPYAGEFIRQGLEIAADPATYITAGTGKQLVDFSLIGNTGKTATRAGEMLNSDKLGITQAGKAPKAAKTMPTKDATIKATDSIDDLLDVPVTMEPVVNAINNTQLPFYPTGTNRLLSDMQNNFAKARAESTRRAAINNLRPVTLDRGVDMSKLPDQYPLPDVSNLGGKVLAERARQQNLNALPGSNPLALAEPTKPNWELGTGEINPEYQMRQLARQQKETVNNLRNPLDEAMRLKRSPDQDLDIIQKASARKVGPFSVKSNVTLDPEAMAARPEYQAAANVADKLGLRLVTYKGTGPRGIQNGRDIYLNSSVKDPVDYLFWHETAHTMEQTHPEHYTKLLEIAQDHIGNGKAIDKHYLGQGYKPDEIPHEFASDAFAEALKTPGFFAKVAEQAPEAIKPLLEAIDQLITRVKQSVSQDDTILPYLRNLEAMRERIRQEVAEPYFKDAMGEKQFADTFRDKWVDSAAKAKEERSSLSSYRTSSGLPVEQARPEEFIVKPDGTSKFGEINPEDGKIMRRQPGEIRLQVGRGEYGLIHIADTRAAEILKLGYEDIPSFVEDVSSGYDRVYQGDGKALLLVKTETPNKLCIVELKPGSEGGQDFYSVSSALAAREGYLNNKELLLQRNEPSAAVPTTAPALRTSHLQGGGEPPIVHGSSSPDLSIGPDANEVNPTGTTDKSGNGTGKVNYKLAPENRAENIRNMVVTAARQIPKSKGFTASFKEQMLQQFPDLADESRVEEVLKYIYDRAQEARIGQTSFTAGGKAVSISKADLTFLPAKAAEQRGNYLGPSQGELSRVQASPGATGIPQGLEERGVSRNIRTDQARPEELRDAISDNPMTYDPLSNKETLAKAQAIYDEGLEPAVTKLNELLADMKPEAAPLVKMIADDLTRGGKVDRARELLSNAAVRATEAGQFGQAFRILREADPQTFLMTMDKQLRKLNEQGRDMYGKKWTDVDLTEAEKQAIAGLRKGDQQGYDDLMGQIGERIANELPSTGLEKWDAWRRMAMLLNPTTHIKNILGNTTMPLMNKFADAMATVLEKVFVKEGQRTKVVGWSLDKNLVDIVARDWEETAKDFAGEKVTLKNLTSNLLSQGRWDIEGLRVLNREKRIFKNNVLEGGNNLSKNTLNAEDYFFKERAYKNALGGYLKANRLTEVTDAAREYAKRRALEATYQDASWLATMLNRAKTGGGIGGKLIDAAVPFVKTPINLTKRSIEYSPYGVLRLLSKQNQNPAKAIEVLSQGLTGTGIAGLGYMLANMGWIRAEKLDSPKAEGLLQAAGMQSYSLITPYGSYTIDWLQPFAVPLFTGVSLYESLKKQDKIDPDAVAESIATGSDAIFNQTMLQGVKKLLGGGFGSVTEQIAGLPVTYIEQGYPAVLGKVARSVDDTKLSTYDTTRLGKLGREMGAKIPFASRLLEPKLDIWGNEQKQGGAVQQFLSPGYFLPKNDDPTTQEVLRLYKSTKETDFLPQLFKGKFSADGVEYKLTPEQLTTFQREMGQENYKDISQALKSPFYADSSDEKKVKKIRKIVQRNYDQEKEKFLKELKKQSD